jgi:hypothetical protein
MSCETVFFSGYGLCIEDIINDASEFDTEDNIIEEIYNSDTIPFNLLSTGYDEIKGTYIYYSPNYIWEMSEKEKALTQEDIKDIIVNVVSKYTNKTKEELKGMIDYVYGSCIG